MLGQLVSGKTSERRCPGAKGQHSQEMLPLFSKGPVLRRFSWAGCWMLTQQSPQKALSSPLELLGSAALQITILLLIIITEAFCEMFALKLHGIFLLLDAVVSSEGSRTVHLC